MAALLKNRRVHINGVLRQLCLTAGMTLADMQQAKLDLEPEAWRAYRRLDEASRYLASAAEAWDNFMEGRTPLPGDRYDPDQVRAKEHRP